MNENIKIREQGGFTLIEIMIAVTVFAIGILAVAAMQIGSVKGNSLASGLTEATLVAQDQMENIISLKDSDPALNDTDNDGIGGLGDASAGTSDGMAASPYIGPTGISYNVFWNVAINAAVPNNKQIRVIVQWVQNGRSRNVSLDSVR